MDSVAQEQILAALNEIHHRPLPPVFKASSKSINSIYHSRRRSTRHLVIGLRDSIFPDAKDLKLVVADHVAESLTLRELLDAIFLSLLADTLRPFSYGRDWVVLRCRDRHSDANRVVAPFDWLMSENINALERYRLEMENMSLEDAGIPLDSELEVVKPTGVDFVGVLAHDWPILAAFENYKSFMGCASVFAQAEAGLTFDAFSYRAVFERARYHPRTGQIFVQRERVSDAELAFLQRVTPPHCMKYRY
jgi:hypothetical protein